MQSPPLRGDIPNRVLPVPTRQNKQMTPQDKTTTRNSMVQAEGLRVIQKTTTPAKAENRGPYARSNRSTGYRYFGTVYILLYIYILLISAFWGQLCVFLYFFYKFIV